MDDDVRGIAAPTKQEAIEFIEYIQSRVGEAAFLIDRNWWREHVPSNARLTELGFGMGRPRIDELRGELDEVRGDAGSVLRSRSMRRFQGHMALMTVRDVFTRQFSFAMPSQETLDVLARYSRRIVDLGAGTGLWAMLLARMDVEVVATDCSASGEAGQIGRFVEVVDISGEDAVDAHPDHDVLCVWPYNSGHWLTEAAKRMKPDRLLFFIGEGPETCGPESFHDLIDDGGHFRFLETVRIATFPHMHDYLRIYQRCG